MSKALLKNNEQELLNKLSELVGKVKVKLQLKQIVRSPCYFGRLVNTSTILCEIINVRNIASKLCRLCPHI